MDSLTSLRQAYRVPVGRGRTIAAADLVGAVLGCEYLFTDVLHWTPRYGGALIAVPLGVAVHTALGIRTPLNSA